ncbi:MAG: terminus macrodomain insulation protein YfbV [Vibrio hibernica]
MSRVSFIHRFKDGQHYMEQWPVRKELAPMFPEQRIIKATRFGIKVMPAVAAISVLLQMSLNNQAAIPQAIVIALFALSLPLQGIWWLGTRSKTVLPPSLANWYRELYQKVAESGIAQEPIKSKPRYKELASMLKRAFRQLDKTTLERWF